MIDDTSQGALLCRAIRVLAQLDINLVITSRPGEAYYFELEGRPATEPDVIRRAAMLDATFVGTPHDRRTARPGRRPKAAARPKPVDHSAL